MISSSAGRVNYPEDRGFTTNMSDLLVRILRYFGNFMLNFMKLPHLQRDLEQKAVYTCSRQA